jgi:hypothetical protein
MAIAWAVLASSVFGVIINTWYSRKLLSYGVLAQLGDQAATLLLSTIAACAAWLASHWLVHAPLALMAAIVAAATAYFGGAMLWRVAAWRELLELVVALRSHSPARIDSLSGDA